MFAILMLVAGIAVGVAVTRWYAKRGYGKFMRRAGGTAAGMLTCVVLILAFGPDGAPPGDAAPASAASTASPPAAASAPPPASDAEEAPTYTDLTPAAIAAAKRYITTLDEVTKSSVEQLPNMDLRDISQMSRRFNALQARGKELFGASIISTSKLWRCGAVGTFAGTLWRSRILGTGSPDEVAQDVMDMQESYDTWRQYCLDVLAGTPVTDEATSSAAPAPAPAQVPAVDTAAVKALDSGIYEVIHQEAATPPRLLIMLEEKGGWSESSMMTGFANHAVRVLRAGQKKKVLPGQETVRFILRAKRTDGGWSNALDVSFDAATIDSMDLRPYRLSAAQILNLSTANVRNSTGRGLANSYCSEHGTEASAFCQQVVR